MFVSKRRWILKTCGTTTPLQCLEPLLELAEKLSGYTDVEHLFYSRKNFKRPELQVYPHRGFEEEVVLLDTFFDNGRAYCLGSINRDCWYLYTYSRDSDAMSTPIVNDLKAIDPDQTIEILMTDLDPDVMSIFTKEECSSAKQATERSGIDTLVPGMVIDDYLFEPCGYSMNGISKIGVSIYQTLIIQYLRALKVLLSLVRFSRTLTLVGWRRWIQRSKSKGLNSLFVDIFFVSFCFLCWSIPIVTFYINICRLSFHFHLFAWNSICLSILFTHFFFTIVHSMHFSPRLKCFDYLFHVKCVSIAFKIK